MIKECRVLLQNEVVTVVRFGNINVQLPALEHKVKTVFVECEDSKYAIVDDNEAIEKNNNKKTTKNNAKDRKKDECMDA